MTPAATQPVPPQVAVVLVTYESAADLPGCVESVGRAAPQGGVDVVVVDNASRDDSAEVARALGLKVIENPANEGYARAMNAGAAASSSAWLLALNPDTRLGPGSLARMLATGGSDPAIGCVGPDLRNPDGTAYPTGRRFPSLLVGGLHALLAPFWPGNPATRHYHMAGSDRSRPLAVDWVSGACMLLRRSAFEAVGGFDGGYFMYFEDMDLCLRLARAGWRVVLDPVAKVEHAGGNSSRRAPYRKVLSHHRSSLRFYTRRFARDPRILLTPLVAAGLALRGAVSLARTAQVRRSEAAGRRPG
ncbi:MAG TPA: glycosyltransferase family 2 protein [Actinomycetota bacterium]|jgi:N-acetylglucosaminyl-diphospho-decaprenol L-rhamnosyltransferase